MAEAAVATKKNIHRSREDVIFDTVIFIILTLILVIVAYPLWWVIISSFSNPKAVNAGQVVWLPVGFTLNGYSEVFEDSSIVRSFINSVIITVMGVLVNLGVTLPTAYALSRDKFSGRKLITWFYVITMFFGGGLIPTYLVVQSCHLINTWWSLILPGSISVYNMTVARTFFKTNIPEELYEAASIDGCTQGRFFFQIALPLSGAITAILVLYYGIGHWNSYFSALIYITNRDKWPLQMVLRSILITNETALQQTANTPEARAAMNAKKEMIELMKYSLIIISSLPTLILYPFIQKHFVKGVMVGSVKG